MKELDNSLHNRWLSTITADAEQLKISARNIIDRLADYNIEARPVWKPMHLQPLFADADYFKHEQDVSKELYETGICLPSDTKMTEEQQQYVIQKIKLIVNH